MEKLPFASFLTIICIILIPVGNYSLVHRFKQAMSDTFDFIQEKHTSPVDPDARLNVTELINSKGYPCENHQVVTEDGFILQIQRIPFIVKDEEEKEEKKSHQNDLTANKTSNETKLNSTDNKINLNENKRTFSLNFKQTFNNMYDGLLSRNYYIKTGFNLSKNIFKNQIIRRITPKRARIETNYRIFIRTLNNTNFRRIFVNRRENYAIGDLNKSSLNNNSNQINTKTYRGVVFLQHGLLDSGTTWVVNYPNESLAFILSDAGFDVWIGNVRGNTYSRRHIKYQPTDKEFWDWSFDEMAKYDLSAMLNYIQRETKGEKINYVGHSQGTMIAHAAFSEYVNLSKLIKSYVALAPVAYVSNIKGAAKFLGEFAAVPEILFKLLGVNEFLPNTDFSKWLATKFCKIPLLEEACQNLLFLLSGFDGNNFNLTRLPVYLAHTPAGTSVKNMVHYAQMQKSNQFQMFDYKCEQLNMLHYNQTTAPIYNLTNLNVPTYFFSATRDYLSDPQDVNTLASQLTNLREHRIIPEWDHLDFIWGLDAAPLAYRRIIEIFSTA